jgi:hypothetical protein
MNRGSAGHKNDIVVRQALFDLGLSQVAASVRWRRKLGLHRPFVKWRYASVCVALLVGE